MTSVTTKWKNKGWLHHRRDILLPSIETRDGTLTQYCTIGIGNGSTSFTRQRIHKQQQEINYAIAFAKDNWSSYKAERINFIRFNTKEAWKSVIILSNSETSHHESSTLMRVRLNDVNIATTDAWNSLVLGPHFAKVFCTDIPVDWYALD